MTTENTLGEGRVVFRENDLLKDIGNELAFVSGNSGAALKRALGEFLEQEEIRSQVSVRHIIPTDILLEIKECFARGEEVESEDWKQAVGHYTKALTIIIQKLIPDKPVSARPKAKYRDNRRTLAVLFAGGDQKVIQREKPSPTFALGTDAHRIMEGLSKKGIGGIKLQDNLKLISDGPKIVGYVYKRRGTPEEKQRNFADYLLENEEKVTGQDLEPFLNNGDGAFEDLDQKDDRVVMLGTPLASPGTGEDEFTTWANSVFSKALSRIKQKQGKLPHTPSDVIRMLRDKDSKKAIEEAIGMAHLIFKVKAGGMNMIKRRGPELELYAGNNDHFRILNWLAIIRATQDMFTRNHLKPEGAGLVEEMPLGNLRVTTEGIEIDDVTENLVFEIKGGVVDLATISVSKLSSESADSPEFNLQGLLTHIEGEFNSQVGKRRRTQRGQGGNIIRETRTKLGTNIRSLFILLDDILGGQVEIDEELNILISDFKFQGGDGGWRTSFDVSGSSLPEDSHLRQMQDYLFFIVSQLCWVNKWKTKASFNEDQNYNEWKAMDLENFSLSLSEIVAYAEKTGILERIKAVIRYQLAEKEITREVWAENGLEDLREWGECLIKKRAQSHIKYSQKLQIQSALKMITRHHDLVTVHREPIELPESLKKICVSFEGYHYLTLDLLETYLLEKFNETELTEDIPLEHLYSFTKEEVIVFWIKDLEEGMVRLAIDLKRLQFRIFRMGVREEEGVRVIRGGLLRQKDFQGIKEEGRIIVNKTNSLVRTLSDKLENLVAWDGFAVAQEFKSAYADGIVHADGFIAEPVPGKPIISYIDPVTGRWTIDPELLEEAVETMVGRDRHGILNLANFLMSGEVDRPVMCPNPTHRNTQTPAAYIHEAHRIRCRGQCDANIYWKPSGYFIPKRRAEGIEVGDYQGISSGVSRTYNKALELGKLLALGDDVLANYLGSRGLEIRNLGQEGVGYYSPKILSSISHLFLPENRKAFGELVNDKHFGRLTPAEVESSLQATDDSAVPIILVNLALELKNLSPLIRDKVSEMLTLRTIKDFGNRGIVGFRKDGTDRASGRIVFPLYWPRGDKVARSNHNARGIKLDGEELFVGGNAGAHIKGISMKGKQIDGVYLLNSPAGIWFNNVDVFLQGAHKDLIILFEGTLNAASFTRISPQYAASCIAMSGKGYKELIAFLRWLGWDENKAGKLCLAYDYDLDGCKAQLKVQEEVQLAFPNVEMINIRDYVPEEVASLIPPVNMSLYTEDEASRIPGPLIDTKTDFNDILTAPGVGKKYAVNGLVRPGKYPEVWDIIRNIPKGWFE